MQGLKRRKSSQPSSTGTRLFTLEHANRTLPLVQRIVADIVESHKRMTVLEEAYESLDPKAIGDRLDEFRRQYDEELENLRVLADELRAVGCELKDWQRGLVDFPALHDGREIYLCWRLGEDRIGHWHEIEAGFHGRRPLGADFGGCDASLRSV